MKNEKTQINLVSLGHYLQGRDWTELSKGEQLEICDQIAKVLRSSQPNSKE